MSDFCIYAHRSNAHKAVVLKDGKVSEAGNPAELITQNGEFARMVEKQREN